MIKNSTILFLALLMVACQGKQPNSVRQPALSSDSSNTREVALRDTVQSNATATGTATPDGVFISGKILMPNRAYRIWEGNDEPNNITPSWLALYPKNGKYAVQQAQYKMQHDDEDPCSGMPTITLESKEQVLVYFNIPTIQKGDVDTAAFNTKIVEAGKSMAFTYNGRKYNLKASGIQFYKDENRNNPDASYTLKLYEGDRLLRTLIHQKEYNDTATEVLFIGDLDKDGQPDFILSSPRDYEEHRLLIILSGSAAVYEGTMQFDC